MLSLLLRDTLFSHIACSNYRASTQFLNLSEFSILRIDTSSGDLKLPHCATSTVFTSSSVVNIFFQTAGRSGGLFLACALLVCVTFAGHSAFTVCSRCMYETLGARMFLFHPSYLFSCLSLCSSPFSHFLVPTHSLLPNLAHSSFSRLSFLLHLAVSITVQSSASLSYAIGRDGALPRQLARINSMSQLPTNAIGAVFVATSLLSLVRPSSNRPHRCLFQPDT